MSHGDTTRIAEYLADHALVLLGIGSVIALVTPLLVLLAIRALAPVRVVLAKEWARLFTRLLDQPGVLSAMTARTRALLAGGYLALHLVLGLTVVAATTVFLVIAEEVGSRDVVSQFDVAFARALRARVTPGWHQLFVTISWLGSGRIIAVVTAVVALILWRNQRGLLALGWAAAQAGGGILNLILKQAFERSRPELADPALASGWSFPSGHAMATFVLCGMSVYVLQRLTRSRSALVTAVALSLGWCLAISFSRLYLGVHFASDVVAGVIAGAAWVAVCISALEAVRQRRNRLAVARDTPARSEGTLAS